MSTLDKTTDDVLASLSDQMEGRRYSGPQKPLFTWTPERVALLKQLWTDGCSGLEISQRFGHGLSRCAVLGKVHRLKLPKRNGPDNESHRINGRIEARRKRKPTPRDQLGIGKAAHIAPLAAKRADPLPMPPPDPLSACSVKFEALEAHHCRFPTGEGRDRTFCGCNTIPGTSWCAHHHARVFKPQAEQGPSKHRVHPQRQVLFYERENENA